MDLRCMQDGHWKTDRLQSCLARIPLFLSCMQKNAEKSRGRSRSEGWNKLPSEAKASEILRQDW